jgi:hypothetical protein
MATYFYSFDSYPDTDAGVNGTIDSYSESSSGVVTITTDTGFSLDSDVVVGDAVKIYDASDSSKFIYAVLTGKAAVIGGGYNLGISYDYNVYADSLADMDKFVVYAKDYLTSITVNENVSYAYKINARIETAAYSEQYIRYKVKSYYDVILDSTRRYFFEDFSNIATASNVIMIDDCASPNGVAYKVYMPETAFELFNNKFRKDVTFRIVA